MGAIVVRAFYFAHGVSNALFVEFKCNLSDPVHKITGIRLRYNRESSRGEGEAEFDRTIIVWADLH